MTDRHCARCERFLSISNTNKDDLCGYCQRHLGRKGIQNWITEGRLRLEGKAPARKVARKAPARLPCNVGKLSDAALVALVKAARAEAEARAAGARKLLTLLEN